MRDQKERRRSQQGRELSTRGFFRIPPLLPLVSETMTNERRRLQRFLSNPNLGMEDFDEESMAGISHHHNSNRADGNMSRSRINTKDASETYPSTSETKDTQDTQDSRDISYVSECRYNSNSNSNNDDDNFTYCSTMKEATEKILDRKHHQEIIQKEACQVKLIRFITLFFIIMSGITVITLSYQFTSLYDKRDFETKYGAYYELLKTDLMWEIKFNMALMKQLGSTMTAGILATSQTPPFVTIPRFEESGGATRDGRGGITMTSFVPLVSTYDQFEWEMYSVRHQGWLEESTMPEVIHANHKTNGDENVFDSFETIDSIPDHIWHWDKDKNERIQMSDSLREDGLFAPLWQTSPAVPGAVNVDLFSVPGFSKLYESMVASNYETVIMPGSHNVIDWIVDPKEEVLQKNEPSAFFLEPIFANFTTRQEAVDSSQQPIGLVLGLTSYKYLFERILPDGGEVYAVLTASEECGGNLTYLLQNSVATFIGHGDLHQGMEEYSYSTNLDMNVDSTGGSFSFCSHKLYIYPTPQWRAFLHNTDKAVIFTCIVALAFFVTSVCFIIYERLVMKREKTKEAALKVVASLFPKGVQDEVLRGAYVTSRGTPANGNVIASFFPETTIMFADIAGFTAWSSTREPEQVFRLLETVYGAIDEIALRRGIFKVETVGDCYVAVCGCPEARDDHAIAMTRFARDCQLRMHSLSRQLEMALGPDTGDLTFRIGLHSGPVTGGVLRGQNARFQLFGDTMNQASRMESTGLKDRIQMSSETAQLIKEAGKEKWIEKRPEKVDVKGKGLQETYLVKECSTGASTTASVNSGPDHVHRQKRPSVQSVDSIELPYKTDSKESKEQKRANKTQRLVAWNTEVLLRRIRAIIQEKEQSTMSLDISQTSTSVEISPRVVNQLQRHVQHIASMYRENPFHNYEHASHVTLSMEKMLSNIKSNGAATNHSCDNSFSGDVSTDFSLNRYTNDLTNDPLAQFAVVYSALIHDVDHSGCSNGQLLKENHPLAIQYNGKSPAENHSINLAWSTLMLPDYRDLVACLCPKPNDLSRLKQLITDAVLATDIFDADLIQNRNARWQQVFGENSEDEIIDTKEIDNLRVMIVLDHLIQASDVAHTMQHWHVYIKWNERLFHEMSDAFKRGRLAKDPAEFWYQGELGFFDKYVIPLAKKLRECGVFGSCFEFLNYAETNRAEWEIKGQDIVRGYVQRYQTKPVEDNNESTQQNVANTNNTAPIPRTRSYENVCDMVVCARDRSLPTLPKQERRGSNPAA